MSKEGQVEFPFQGSLLPQREPRPGEKGYLEPGFTRNEKGEIVDEEGNVYGEDYTLRKEVPSPEFAEGLRIARERAKERLWPEEETLKMAKFYAHQLKQKKLEQERLRRKRKRKPAA
ncbi:hypothetical protein C4587_02820 [Candidatus Parcubacteria bacterium]|nr:MAG: hypothetical protein C4587_02820 [Candidatus Parcubacteria bacterium]